VLRIGMCVCVYPHRRRIPSKIISQSESGVVFKHSSEYPDLPQPQKCLPVTADDKHQGNKTKSDQKGVYRAHREPYRTCNLAELSCQGVRSHSGNIPGLFSQGPFRAHSNNIQGTFGAHSVRAHSGPILETFWGHSVSAQRPRLYAQHAVRHFQGTLGARSGNIQGPIGEHSGPIGPVQGPFRAHSV
jgi:hypothetical protein